MKYMNEFEDLLDKIISECSGKECNKIFSDMIERLQEILS